MKAHLAVNGKRTITLEPETKTEKAFLEEIAEDSGAVV